MPFQEYYNQKSYNKISRFRKEAVLSFIKKEGALILDIGCSDGTMGYFVKETTKARVYGLDISKDAIEQAKQRLDGAFVFDIEDKVVDFPDVITDKKFDYIIISEVLEHLLHPEQVLEKIKGLMHKDAEVIITVPNVLFWKNRFKIFFGKFDYQTEGLMDRGHIHFFTLKSLYKTIFQSGFKVIDYKYNTPTRLLKFIKNIFPGFCSYQFAVCAKKKDKVIYTSIFGDRDDLIDPKVVSDDFHYVCFTDSDIKSDIWQVKKVSGDFTDPVLSAKIYKILPHRYFADYDVSVWIDANFLIKKNISSFIDNILTKTNIAFYDHSQLSLDSRSTVAEEVEALLLMIDKGKKNIDSNQIRKQIQAYKEDGFLDDNGLIAGGFILRKHNDVDVIDAMEAWWAEIKKYTTRDQLSFNYIAWKQNLAIFYIDGDLRNNKYFQWINHKR